MYLVLAQVWLIDPCATDDPEPLGACDRLDVDRDGVGAVALARRSCGGAGDAELGDRAYIRLVTERYQLTLAERARVVDAVAARIELRGLGWRAAVDLAPAVDADQRRRRGVVIALSEECLLAALATRPVKLEIRAECITRAALSAYDRGHCSPIVVARLAR
jgi:hypothetical protein